MFQPLALRKEDTIQRIESVKRKHTNKIYEEGHTQQDADQPRKMFRKKKMLVVTSNSREKPQHRRLQMY